MMNASHPITHRRGSSLAATMTTLLLSMIPLVTLAENTDQMILKQQQTSVAAAERKPNTAKISPSYTTNYVGNTNKLPYPQRPRSIIQIDLDYFLHVMENITSAADTMAKSDDDAETFHVPKNPVVNSYPRKRLLLWSELTSADKQYATHLLNYNEYSWDNPMTNSIEMTAYRALSSKLQSGLSALEITPSQWDCHVNHYYGYYWDDLMKAGLHIHFAMLGWDRESWDYENVTHPDVEGMTWSELSEKQKVIAKELCYFRETWDELPLSRWLVDWREKLYESEREPAATAPSSSNGVSSSQR